MQRFVQLALDFLGGDAKPVSPPPATVSPVAAPAAAPAAPLSEVFQPGTWHHPQANRLIRLRDCEVAYAFKRGKRRTIGLSVSPEGLTVNAPRWTPVAEVEALLYTKADWVMDKLRLARTRARELDRKRVDWADGAVFEFLGAPARLVIDPAHARATAGGTLEPAGADGVAILRLGLPHGAERQRIQDAAQAWLMRQAQALFVQRLDHFAPQLGVRYTRMRLSSAGTRWGSASADGSIRLNWRLIHLPQDLIDYVVVHELSHLRHMDHSPRFWAVVASVMPDHAERRLALRRAAVPLDD